jgi:hypothetical protein
MRSLVRPEQRRHFDSGDYPEALRQAVDAIGLAALRERQQRGEPDGRRLGVGIAMYSEHGAVTDTAAAFCTAGVVGCPANGPALARAIPASYGISPNGFLGGVEAGYFFRGQYKRLQHDRSRGRCRVLHRQRGGNGRGAALVSRNRPRAARLDPARSAAVLRYRRLCLWWRGVQHAADRDRRGPCNCGPSPTVLTNASSTLTGWTVGGGGEWMFAPHWTVKGEYLYYDLGSTSYAVPTLTQLNGAGMPFFGAGVAASSSIKGGLTRLGVNFKF